jgi:hypothetical protein
MQRLEQGIRINWLGKMGVHTCRSTALRVFIKGIGSQCKNRDRFVTR